MASIYLIRNNDGFFSPSSINNSTHKIEITNPQYHDNFWGWDKDLIITMKVHFSESTDFMYYHPGSQGSFGHFLLDFTAAVLNASSVFYNRNNASFTTAKDAMNTIENINKAAKDFQDMSKYPHEGYYIETECIIKGKIKRSNLY